MKHYNDKTEMVIMSYEQPVVNPSVEEPELDDDGKCLHKRVVKQVEMFVKVKDGRYEKIVISRGAIMELARHIAEIEAQEPFMATY